MTPNLYVEKIKTLEAEIASQKATIANLKIMVDRFQIEATGAKGREAAARIQFDDLKMRLAAAESTNQMMRGYISRVQEDDVVREELIATGDPDGEQAMVPKRKPSLFLAPDNFSPTGEIDYSFRHGYNQEPHRKSKHWITY